MIKCRTLLNVEKFDELIQRMVNAVNNPQQGPRYSMKEDNTQTESSK